MGFFISRTVYATVRCSYFRSKPGRHPAFFEGLLRASHSGDLKETMPGTVMAGPGPGAYRYYCRNYRLKKSFAALLAVCWLLFITVLFCLPGSALPHEPWYDKIWLDKWVHVSLFVVLLILWCGWLSNWQGKKLRAFIWVAVAFFAYGVAIEFIQKYFIPNRSFDGGDIIADAIGIAVGTYYAARTYIKK